MTPQLLDQFHAWLAARNIQPGINDWIGAQEFITNRLKTEIFNQAFGVEKGDRSGSAARSGDSESARSRSAADHVAHSYPSVVRTRVSTGSSGSISTPSGAVFKSANLRALTITRDSSEPTALL